MATGHKGTSTKKGRRLPGSLVAAGAQQAPRKPKIKDRMNARPTGQNIDWATARKHGVNGR